LLAAKALRPLSKLLLRQERRIGLRLPELQLLIILSLAAAAAVTEPPLPEIPLQQAAAAAQAGLEQEQHMQ
jgi:hypothetical protein